MFEKLIKDIKESAKLAMQSTYTVDDMEGSCNMDHVFLHVEGNRVDIEKAIKQAGFIPNTSGRDRSFFIMPPGAWQGAKRTRWAQTFSKEMENRGYSSGVVYIMD